MCEDEYRLSREDVSLKLFWLFSGPIFGPNKRAKRSIYESTFLTCVSELKEWGQNLAFQKISPTFLTPNWTAPSGS